MASISLVRGKCRAQIRRSDYKPVSKSFDTEREARAWARSIEADMDRRKYDEPSTIRQSEAIDEYTAKVRGIGRTKAQCFSTLREELGSLPISKLKSVVVPLPPADEQAVIVDAVRRAESGLQPTVASVEAGAQHSAALRQAVLAAAFRDRLVPQDPADEPAAGLLACLASQSVDTPPPFRRQGRSAGRVRVGGNGVGRNAQGAPA